MLQDLSVSVSCRLYVSVLQAKKMSHVAGNESVSVLQAVTMSMCCKLQQCQCVAHINICQCVASSHNVCVVICINICKCVAGCHNVNVLQALTVSVCCTHYYLSECCKLSQYQCVACIYACKCVSSCHNVSVLQALTVSACVLHTLTFVSALQA